LNATLARWAADQNDNNLQGKAYPMHKTRVTTALALLALLAAAPLLSACHTAAGAAQDVSNAGQVVKKDVQSATPNP